MQLIFVLVVFEEKYPALPRAQNKGIDGMINK